MVDWGATRRWWVVSQVVLSGASSDASGAADIGTLGGMLPARPISLPLLNQTQLDRSVQRLVCNRTQSRRKGG